MGGCCSGPDCSALDASRRRVLWTVLVINLVMFVGEFATGLLVGSMALQADSLDALGDVLVYGFSLAVVGGPLLWKSYAGLLKGVIMLVFGGVVLVQLGLKLAGALPPSPPVVSVTAVLALAANLVCLALLTRHRNDDVNMRSTWICSRNDIVVNTSVIASAGLVALTHRAWPDLLVSAGIVALFLSSARGVIRDSRAGIRAERASERTSERTIPPVELDGAASGVRLTSARARSPT